MHNRFSIWKTTLLGGVLFLLPFALVVFLLGQIAQVILLVAEKLNSTVGQWSVGGVSLTVLLAALLLLLLCFAAGIAARRSLGRQFSEKVERNVMLFFPRYAIWKSQLASNFGTEQGDAGLQPVLVVFDELARIGFEIERTSGDRALAIETKDTVRETAALAGDAVTIYLPGSPDVWAGHLVHVGSERVRPLPLTFAEAAALCESMGRGAGAAVGFVQSN